MDTSIRVITGGKRAGSVAALLVFVGGAISLVITALGPIGAESGPVLPLHPHVVARIPIGSLPGSVAQAGGSIWVAVQNPSFSTAPAKLVRIDPITNKVVARVPLERFPDSIVGGGGALWASRGGRWPGTTRVLRIDPETNQIVNRIWGAGGDLVFGAGSVWTYGHLSSGPSIVRIDPDTNGIVATIPVPPRLMALAFGERHLWLLRANGNVLEIDPRSDRITRTIHTHANTTWMAAGAGALWLERHDDVIRVDMTTGRVERETIPASTVFRPFAFGLGGAWIVGGPSRARGICRLNAATLEADSCVDPGRVGDLEASHPVMLLDERAGAIWVAVRHTVTRIDLR